MKKVVIALGGNALQARGEAATSENQLKNVLKTAEHIAKIISEDTKVSRHRNQVESGERSFHPIAVVDIVAVVPHSYIIQGVGIKVFQIIIQ